MPIEIQPEPANGYTTTDLKFAAFLRTMAKTGKASLTYQGAEKVPGRDRQCRFSFLIDPELLKDLKREFDNDAELPAYQLLYEYEQLKKSAFL